MSTTTQAAFKFLFETCRVELHLGWTAFVLGAWVLLAHTVLLDAVPPSLAVWPLPALPFGIAAVVVGTAQLIAAATHPKNRRLAHLAAVVLWTAACVAFAQRAAHLELASTPVLATVFYGGLALLAAWVYFRLSVERAWTRFQPT